MIKHEIAYALCAACLCAGGIMAAILYKSNIEISHVVIDLIQECEAKLPRDVKCILVAKPEVAK